ncbi:MAG: DNA-3-methyladenine glycosylase 2 family protein [Acidobacteriota bacterium]|nr:DNA-3-methyladenine glycosylase 2 family protein [Acidobacteriota bacterium]
MEDEILTLTEENYPDFIQILCERDRDLRGVVENFGEPPIWIRPSGFPTLVHIVLEQQVSLASALASYEKLKRIVGEGFNPESFLRLSEDELKSCGFSRQKILYTRNLAGAIISEYLNLNALEYLSDDAVKTELTKLKGIGRWTADIYLLMCLRRADAFPVGDLGLIVGTKEIKKLEQRPTSAELELIAENWKPFRAVATRIIWHYYLSRRK